VSDADWSGRRFERLPSSLPGPSSLPTLSDSLVGTVGGGCAFVVGYAVTFLFEGRRVRSPTRPLLELYSFGIDAGGELNVGPTGPLPGPHTFVTWHFLSLHGAGFERRAQDYWTLAPPETRLLVFVPAVLLVFAGGAVVVHRGAEDPWTGAKRGGAVALGYLPLVVLVALASQWTAPESVAIERFGLTTGDSSPIGTIGVSARHVAPVAGVAYPVAFGAVGGYLAFVWSERSVPTTAIGRGLAAGAVAFTVGWAVAVRQTFARDRGARAWEFAGLQHVPGTWHESVLDGATPDSLVLGTWHYHRRHGGDIDVRYLGDVADGMDLLVLPRLSVSADLAPIYPVAPAVLVLAGAALALTSDRSNWRDATVRGASVALGYLPLSLATAVATTWGPRGPVAAVLGVDLTDAFLLTGLAYPAVLGGVGGIVAYSITRRARAVTGDTD